MSKIVLRSGVEEIEFLGARPWPPLPEGMWEFSDLIGWQGLTDDKYPPIERPQAHGAFEPEESLRSRRPISFSARAVSSEREIAESYIDSLSAIGASAPVEMILETDSGRSSRRVSVVAVTPKDRRNRSVASVDVDLLAADSRRYALSEDVPWVETDPPSSGTGLVWPAAWPLTWPGSGSTGRIELFNSGKAPSAPEFQLLGGFATALVTCVETGARIGLDRPIPDGAVASIDTAEHSASLDGQASISRWLRWHEWELVPPGETRTYQFDATGTTGAPKMRGRVRPAWW
jgi:hypothetical protein